MIEQKQLYYCDRCVHADVCKYEEELNNTEQEFEEIMSRHSGSPIKYRISCDKLMETATPRLHKIEVTPASNTSEKSSIKKEIPMVEHRQPIEIIDCKRGITIEVQEGGNEKMTS